jgi:hypothetical protein
LSQVVYDLSNCCGCNDCCNPASQLFASCDFDWLLGGDFNDIEVELTKDGARHWTGSADCNEVEFTINLYCIDGLWYFDLFVEGDPDNYGNPALNEPGAVTLDACDPFEAHVSINNYDYADFPFCDRTGDFLNSLIIVFTE